jgi:hypothetical protein
LSLFFAVEGVARATQPCPPGTHPSHVGFLVAGALSLSGTLAVLGLGLKITLGRKGSQRLLAGAVTILAVAACAFIGFWFTVIVSSVFSGCVKG